MTAHVHAWSLRADRQLARDVYFDGRRGYGLCSDRAYAFRLARECGRMLARKEAAYQGGPPDSVLV